MRNSPLRPIPGALRNEVFPPLSFDGAYRDIDLFSIIYAQSSGIVPKLTQFQYLDKILTSISCSLHSSMCTCLDLFFLKH
jgi:hypothetical protein